MFEEIRDPGARVRALCDYGSQLTEVDTNIPVFRYFRSGKEMIRMAEVYIEEGCLEKAFILYSKFIILFVEKLKTHPGYKNSSSTDKTRNKSLLQKVFPKAELLKAKLKDRYAAEEERRKAEENAQLEKQAREEEQRQKELTERMREEERSKQDENQRRLALEQKLLAESEEQLRLMKLEQEKRNAENVTPDSAFHPSAGSLISSVIVSSTIPTAPSPSESLPPPPSYFSVVSNNGPVVPDRNLKPSLMPSSFDANAQPSPSVDRSLKPIGHFTSVGDVGLKTIYVPNELITKFLSLALQNTSKSIETCGILCGKLAHSTWRITHLLVPHQHGQPDSCDITNEEDVAEYQDENELITLGWIHTHPTQTAFLSSVDQHTHWPYQKLLPEAIAIVCSPKFQDTGFFYLTPDYGMDFIRNCSGKGFHEHPKLQPIFETCPHVQIDHTAKVNIVDLRR